MTRVDPGWTSLHHAMHVYCIKTYPLWNAIFIPIMLLTCHQLTSIIISYSIRCFLLASHNFYSLLLPLSQCFWNVLLPSDSKWVFNFQKTINNSQLNILYVVFVLFLIKDENFFCKTVHSVSVYSLYSVPTLQTELYIVSSMSSWDVLHTCCDILPYAIQHAPLGIPNHNPL